MDLGEFAAWCKNGGGRYSGKQGPSCEFDNGDVRLFQDGGIEVTKEGETVDQDETWRGVDAEHVPRYDMVRAVGSEDSSLESEAQFAVDSFKGEIEVGWV